jgi:hypothetical protein
MASLLRPPASREPTDADVEADAEAIFAAWKRGDADELRAWERWAQRRGPHPLDGGGARSPEVPTPPVTRGKTAIYSRESSLVRTRRDVGLLKPSCNRGAPRPSCNRGAPRPDLADLENSGRRVVPSKLGEMPDGAGALDQAVAEDVAYLHGLFASAGELRPLPYSARFGAERHGTTPMAICRTLKKLVAWGVLPKPTELKVRNGQPRGTLAFALPAAQEVVPALPAVARSVEPDGGFAVGEREEVGDDVAVFEAVAEDGREVLERGGGFVAVRDRATFGHNLERIRDHGRLPGAVAMYDEELQERWR